MHLHTRILLESCDEISGLRRLSSLMAAAEFIDCRYPDRQSKSAKPPDPGLRWNQGPLQGHGPRNHYRNIRPVWPRTVSSADTNQASRMAQSADCNQEQGRTLSEKKRGDSELTGGGGQHGSDEGYGGRGRGASAASGDGDRPGEGNAEKLWGMKGSSLKRKRRAHLQRERSSETCCFLSVRMFLRWESCRTYRESIL